MLTNQSYPGKWLVRIAWPMDFTFVGPKYEIPDGPLKGLGFGVGGRYYSAQAADLPNTVDLLAYGILDMAAYYTVGGRGAFKST